MAVNPPAPPGTTPLTQLNPRSSPSAGPSSPGLQAQQFGALTDPQVGAQLIQPYQTLQQAYLQPLTQQPQIAPPQLDDPTLTAIQQRLAALQASDPILNGSAAPHPKSVLSKHVGAGQIAAAVGQQTWEQMVAQPFHDFIDTWKRDPKMGLAETAGGLALIGGIVGLEALTGGAATPLIFAASAALVAPGMISAWTQEIQNPTDQNLVKALVNTSTGVLSVGVPTKYFAGATNARALLSDVMKTKQTVATLQDASDLMMPVRTREQIRIGVPLGRQMETLASDYEGLRAQLDARGITESDPAQQLLTHTATVQKMTKDVLDSGGDPELLAQLKDYVQTVLNPARLQVASEHLFLPNNPYTHVPMTPVEGASKELYDAVTPLKSAAIARINRLANGYGVDSFREGISSVLETQALRRAGGAARSTAQSLQTAIRDLRSVSGVPVDSVEKVLQGLEEPDLWKELSPEEQVFGQALRDVFDSMTAAELRHGTISLALAGRMPRFSQGIQTEGATSPVLIMRNWLKAPTRDSHRTWQAAIDLATGEIESRSQTRRQWAEAPGKKQAEYEAYAPHRQALAAAGDEIRRGRRSLGGFQAAITRAKKAGRDTTALEEKAAAFADRFKQDYGDIAHGLLTGKPGEIAKAESRRPATAERILGQDALDLAVGSHVNRMHMATIRQDLESLANLKPLEGVFGKLPEKFWGVAMHQPEFQGKFEKPAIVPETFFAGDGKSSPEANANGLGYVLVHPGVGTPKDFHYKPALYALNEGAVDKETGLRKPSLAMQILQAGHDANDSAELSQGLAKSLYGVVSTSKRFIMGSPAWHAMNVAGRAIGFLLQDPAVAGSAFKAVRAMHADPALYAHVDEEFAMAGGVRANRFEIGAHLRRMQKEEDGQYGWPSLLRNFERPLAHAYGDIVEGGFWKSVHDVQLAGYVYAKQALRDRLGAEHPEQEIQKLAAQYANNLGGMVNPLYMSKLYRHMRNLMWFAPSYWATFMRSVASAFPGAARISKITAERDGGRFVRMSAVPLKAISDRGRVELVRAQRDWFLTYMMAGAATADMLNVMLGGRHLWDNDQGRMFDINVDRIGQPISNIPLLGGLISPGGPANTKSGPKHIYISGFPLFRQMADVGNALGLGHDWGFAHQFSDETWQKQDALHKAMMLAGGLLDGVRRQGATKVGGLPQAGYAALTGEDLSARLGKGVNQKVDRTAALASLVPGGYAIQQAVTDASTPGSNRGVGQDLQAVGQSLLTQYTGIPSMYHMGTERPAIDDSQFQKWVNQRNQIHDQMLGASKALFAGSIQPIQYQRQKQQALDHLDQLNKDIFGDSSAAASLSQQRAALSQQFGLDDPGLSDAEWYARYDAYETAWQQQLQAAPPETRALWWENNTSQWTDADYLEWEAKQLRDSMAASIDGQGGNYIKAYQNMLAQNRPLLSQSEYTALEESDPYYSAYKAMLSTMGSTSVLGAFVSAFSSPFSQTYMAPAGLSEDEAQAMAQATGRTVVRPEAAAQQAQQAKKVAQSQQVAEAGGEAGASPAFQQEAQQDILAAQEGQSA